MEDSLLMEQRKKFWEHQEPTILGMIQTEGDDTLATDDTEEMLQYLPDYTGGRVIDLAAGIGRFTGPLASSAGHVIAVDIAENLVNENRARHSHLNNVCFICSDVIDLDFPDGSLDLVFSSWILKYLSDSELSVFLPKVLNWLSKDGFFFFRESCFKPQGTLRATGNPTIFRDPQDYLTQILQARDKEDSGFKILRFKNNLAYIKHKNAANQLCFLAKKISKKEIDSQSCTYTSPLKAVFNGATTDHINKTVTTQLNLREEQCVLLVGCGEGQLAEHMAREYQVNVNGIDGEHLNVLKAIERQMKVDGDVMKKMSFESGNLFEVNRKGESYDVIYCCDSIQCYSNKESVFDKLYKWLRKGGILFITDFTVSSNDTTVKQQIKNTLTNLNEKGEFKYETVDALVMKLCETGFKNVNVKDINCELKKMIIMDGGSIPDDVLKLVENGHLSWTSFMATK